MEIELARWSEEFRDAFRVLHADPDVMADLGGPYDRAESDEKLERYRDGWTNDRTSRWAIIDDERRFLGYAGVMWRGGAKHPLGPHHEVGWQIGRAHV